MTQLQYYRVAGFLLSVSLPMGKDADSLLPSFRPFRVVGEERGDVLFRCSAKSAAEAPCLSGKTLLEETDNDMGHLRLYAVAGGYAVEVTSGSYPHLMVASADFTQVEAFLHWEDAEAGNVLSAMSRVAFAQSALSHGAISLHAAAVYVDGRAYLFMGKSGTGKSTHAQLWREHIAGAELLNDDNPAVRFFGDTAYACGTPWSGKTPCYKNLQFPIGGMARLSQAAENRFQRQEGADAFVAIYPGCSVIAENETLRHHLYDTLTRLANSVKVGTLECLPNGEAARLCYREMSGGW